MLVDSRKEKLDQMAIIKEALTQTKSPYTLEEGIAAIVAECRASNAIPIREGNTIFIVLYDPKDKRNGMFRALNADVSSQYLKNSIEFIRAVGLMGMKTLVTDFTDPTIINIFKYIYRNAPFPNMGYKILELKDNKGYRGIINLGDAKKNHKGSLPANSEKPKSKGALK
jgi:hypothetical protein